jgi:hypothetical protein
MKKHLLILSAVALAFTAKVATAQDTLYNPGFEIWTTNSLAASAMDPNKGSGTTGWWEFNVLNSSFVGSSPISVTRCSDTVHGGTYSARIESVVLTSTSYGYISKYGFKDTLGMVITGNLAVSLSGASFKSGIPFNSEISNLSFYYQYAPNGVDSAECLVALYKWNGTSRTQVGGGVFKTNASTAGKGWQQANVPVACTATPDTMVVEISASSLYSKPKPSSMLYVDDASVTLLTGINEPLVIGSSVQVYPNPASTAVNFSITGMYNTATLSVFDITGQKISSSEVHDGVNTVSTQALSNGIYFYQLYTNNGNLIKTGKFTVVK